MGESSFPRLYHRHSQFTNKRNGSPLAEVWHAVNTKGCVSPWLRPWVFAGVTILMSTLQELDSDFVICFEPTDFGWRTRRRTIFKQTDLCFVVLVVQNWFCQDVRGALQVFVRTRLWLWMQLLFILLFFVVGKLRAVDRWAGFAGLAGLWVSTLLGFRAKLGTGWAQVTGGIQAAGVWWTF